MYEGWGEDMFISCDPQRDGTNWYVYCANSPLNFVDRNGLESESIKELYVNISNRGISIYSESKNNLAIITFDGSTNNKGAFKGTLDIYTPSQFDTNHNLNPDVTEPALSVPIISGSDFTKDGNRIVNSRIQNGIYTNAYKRNPNSEILKDESHVGNPESGTSLPIWDIPNSGERVTHIGNTGTDINNGYTEGCPAITGVKPSEVQQNYNNFMNIMGDSNMNIIVLDSSMNYGINGETYAEK